MHKTLCDNKFSYSECNDNIKVDENIVIRSWDSEEWIEPTVDIYERDVKVVRNDR